MLHILELKSFRLCVILRAGRECGTFWNGEALLGEEAEAFAAFDVLAAPEDLGREGAGGAGGFAGFRRIGSVQERAPKASDPEAQSAGGGGGKTGCMMGPRVSGGEHFPNLD